jgi:hypothetical protein
MILGKRLLRLRLGLEPAATARHPRTVQKPGAAGPKGRLLDGCTKIRRAKKRQKRFQLSSDIDTVVED